jgi:hypothetical protein
VKLEMSLFAGMWLVGITLLARMQIQGVEAALFSMAVEHGVRVARAGSTVARNTLRWIG